MHQLERIAHATKADAAKSIVDLYGPRRPFVETVSPADELSDVLARVKAILSRLSGVNDVGDCQPIGLETDGLGLDSLDRIECAVALEEEFSLPLSDDEIDDPQMSTAAGIARHIVTRWGQP
jgi:acyl carrier protein